MVIIQLQVLLTERPTLWAYYSLALWNCDSGTHSRGQLEGRKARPQTSLRTVIGKFWKFDMLMIFTWDVLVTNLPQPDDGGVVHWVGAYALYCPGLGGRCTLCLGLFFIRPSSRLYTVNHSGWMSRCCSTMQKFSALCWWIYILPMILLLPMFGSLAKCLTPSKTFVAWPSGPPTAPKSVYDSPLNDNILWTCLTEASDSSIVV